MIYTDSNINSINDWADFWYYEIGVNVIPADTENKKTYEHWSQCQDKPIPEELQEERKRNGEYNKGIALVPGQIWRGKNKGKYLNGIDCDNKKAIEEICTKYGKKISLQELAKWTIVEQHKDNPDKAHIYIISTRPFKNKSSIVVNSKLVTNINNNEIPAIEVKCEKRIMFCSPSIHKDGYPYEILDCKEPALCDEFELHIDDICRKYGIDYLQQQQNNENVSSGLLSEPLRQIINLLDIPSDFQYNIRKGQRHATMLSFANSLLIKHRDNNRDKLKNFFIEVNNKICSPPLPVNELINSIWRDALTYSEKMIENIKIINNNKDNYYNQNISIVIPLQIGKKLQEEDIVQTFVRDIKTNSIILELNHKYEQTKVIVPIKIKKWLDVRKHFEEMLEEKGVSKEHIFLLKNTLDNNFDLIKKNDDTDGGDAGDIGDGGTTKIAYTLVKLALENSKLFKDDFNVPHILVKINDHYEVLPIEGTKFKRYLSKLYYDTFDNKIANTEAINNAIQILEAKSIFEGQTITLHLRTAWSDNITKDAIYYDLSDAKNRCVKITKDNWKIIDNQIEVLFRRYNHLIPQIEPIPRKIDDMDNIDDKILDKFLNLLNVKDEDNKLLLKCYIISLFIPGIAKPILMLHGEQGSAKSTLQELIKMLVDPSTVRTLTFPRDINELIQLLSHHYVAYFDNVSYIKEWISDALCRAATGSGFSKRQLYTDDDDIIYNFKRCLGINGINLAAAKADLLDRGIIIQLERIPKERRRKLEDIWKEFEKLRPQLLGYIFDILVKVLQIKQKGGITIPNGLNRMADWEEYAEIISRCIGYREGEFLRVYQKNINIQIDEAIAASPLSMAVVELMNLNNDENKEEWDDTPTELYLQLNDIAETKLKINIQKIKAWPKSPNSLSRRLNEVKTNLREKGILIEWDKDKKGNRIIKIRKISSISPYRQELENQEQNPNKSLDDTLDDTFLVSSNNNNENQAQNNDFGRFDDVDDTLPSIHRIYPNSDIWACEDCNFTGDKWFMRKHPCKNNNNKNNINQK